MILSQFSINLISLLFSIKLCSSSDYERHYDGYSVIRVTPNNKNQLQFLSEWAFNISEREDVPIDFWKYPSKVKESVDIMVPPEIRPEVIDLLESVELEPQVTITNVEKYPTLYYLFNLYPTSYINIITTFNCRKL